MRIFKITPKIEVVCLSESTRYGFRHLATLLIDGREAENDKCCYYNRTWERFEFQSVLLGVINKAEKNKIITKDEGRICRKFAEQDHTDWSGFKLTAMTMAMGDVLGKDKKEKNDWKARMLKAGLGKKGLELPDDWEELDEDEKERRLENVGEFLKEKR